VAALDGAVLSGADTPRPGLSGADTPRPGEGAAAAAATAAHRANLRGIRLMTASMGCFIINDTLVKVVSESLPAGQLIFVRGVMATLLILAVVRASGTPVAPQHLARGWVGFRSGVDALATFCYLLSLFQLPIANATAINMATPLVITLMAVVVLGERVGPLRWGVIMAGFGGVLLVIQPGAEGFNAWAWLCLLGTLLHAVRDVVTRRIPADVPSLTVTLATAVAVTLLAAGLAGLQGWAPMSGRQFGLLTCAAVFLAGGYHLLIRATRTGDLSVAAPFRYSGLLMAVAAGWVVWGQVPNPLAWAGIALVVGSGLYLLKRPRG
jgi:drug/metabolite transporter (DMT)-like permease